MCYFINCSLVRETYPGSRDFSWFITGLNALLNVVFLVGDTCPDSWDQIHAVLVYEVYANGPSFLPMLSYYGS